MLVRLDASAVRRWSSSAADALAHHQDEIDELNVYPVPDGDTGTNLALTMRAAATAVSSDRSARVGDVLAALARGAVLGARGNSGVILAQILRGIADALAGEEACAAAALAAALRCGADLAYTAVAEPVEGTMLSVMAAAADAAQAAADAGPDADDAIGAVSEAALTGAQAALARTPEQLPELARAGVVDAGGRGLVVVFEALCGVVTGRAPSVADVPARRPRDRSVLETARETGSDRYAYEVQYLLHADESAVECLKPILGSLGDSLVVVGTGESLWNVHVHVDDVGAAIEAGIDAGRPHRITVARFADQARAAAAEDERSGVAIVAVAPGEGLADVFRAEGVHVVEGGPGDNPSTAEVLDVLRATGAARIVLLPNATQIGGVADSAAEQARAEGMQVAVVPTRSPVQGLAAVAVHDPDRRFEDDVITMAETAASTRWAEVTVAVRESLTMAGRCQPGDVLGLIEGEVVEIGHDVVAVGESVIDRLLGVGGELVTILLGADAEPDAGERMTAHLTRTIAHAEVAVFVGGQPHYPLLIGVE